IAGVHQPAEPGRGNGVENAQHALRRKGQPPVVFQRQDDAALLRFRQALLDAVNAPAERIVIAIAGQGRLDAAQLHQPVEGLDGSPAARIEPYAGNAHLVRKFDTVEGMGDVLLADVRVRGDEVLMNGEADQVYPLHEGPPLEILAVGPVFAVHLSVQDVHAGRAEFAGLVYDRLDGDLRIAEMPVGVGGDAEFDARRLCVLHRVYPFQAMSAIPAIISRAALSLAASRPSPSTRTPNSTPKRMDVVRSGTI